MEIILHTIELWTCIGVPEAERAVEQRVLATVRILCTEGASLSDVIEDTVDYDAVIHAIRACCKTERKTLEKFAADIANAVLTFKRVNTVEVSLTKHAIPGTEGTTITLHKP